MKLLTTFVEQFHTQHGRLPDRIEVSPLAMVVLAARRSVAPKWGQIPVICHETDVARMTKGDDAKILGVDVEVEDRVRLVAFGLRGVDKL